MDSNPYPSPPSSSASADIEVNNYPPGATAESQIRADLESEDNEPRSFQRTIGRLDAAFSRIRQLRRDLLAGARNQDGLSPTSIGPAHEAIVLTGQRDRSYNEEAMERMRSIVPSDVRERLRQFEARRTEADRERDRELFNHQLLRAAAAHMLPIDTSVTPSSHPTSSQSSFSPNSPLSPPRQRLLPQRTLLDTQPLRRRELSDDPNTDLGRRVALRESASNSPSSRDGSRALPTLIERDFEYIQSLPRQRRTEPIALRRIESSLDHLRREMENRTSRSMDHSSGLQSSSAGAPTRGPIRRSRILPSRQNSIPSSTSSTLDRLSLLSNFSVQNLPTPNSATSQQPLLFDEPTSYIQSPHSQAGEDRDRQRMESIDEESQGRSYIVRQSDRVHNINLNWEEVPSGSLLMSSPVGMELPPDVVPRVVRGDHRRDDTVTVQPSEYLPVYQDTASRHVLDQGFDRSSFEDARHPYERPVRSRWQPSIRLTRDEFGSITRTQTTQDYDGEEDANPRVRLFAHDPGDGFLYTILPNGTCARRPRPPCSDPPKVFGTSAPRFIDPLPSALVDKYSSSSIKPSRLEAGAPKLSIPTHACLPGR